MKFSILLPTRNRLDLLRLAVRSVLEQDYGEWEIVVADNASSEDVGGFVASLRESRVRYVRSDTVLPVTENWNRSLEHSGGDYFIMLGDDDCLMRGCLRTVGTLLKDFARPDVLYTEAVQYAYPGVMPGRRSPFIQFGYCEFMGNARQPFLLDRSEALRMVRKSLRFEIGFGYNMQHSFVSRALVDKLRPKGPFFQSPYPDYYATNAAFLAAERILVSPWPLVAIGISPKSFGWYYFNQREDEGVEFLKNVADPDLAARVKPVTLPGSNMNTSWLLSMEALKRNFSGDTPLAVSYWRYRFIQFRSIFSSSPSLRSFLAILWRRGTTLEITLWSLFAVVVYVQHRLFRNRWPELLNGILDWIHTSHPGFNARIREVPYQDILELQRSEDPIALAEHCRPATS